MEIENDNNLLVPYDIRIGRLDWANYSISLFGLSSDTVGYIVLDGKYELKQSHPFSDIYICPIKPNPQPCLNEIWFYTNCLSYLNELPAIPIPNESDLKKYKYEYLFGKLRKSKYKYIHHSDITKEGNTKNWVEKVKNSPNRKYQSENSFYFESLATILNEIRENKHGIGTHIRFYIELDDKKYDLPYQSIFSKSKKEISLYASALRQSDILSEYLNYYRIIESIAKKNHKNYISDNLDKIENYDYGILNIKNEFENFAVKPKNIFDLMKKRAMKRKLLLLKKYKSNEGIAKYLYNTVRCGIAHGKDDIIEYTISRSYFEINEDIYILKLIARKGINDLLLV